MGRRKLRTGELRDEVLGVATGLLADGGTGAVTTRAVAAGAGTSLAAVNELFGGKAGLIREIFAAGFAELAADLRGLGGRLGPGEDPDESPDEGVVELALAVRSFARRRPHLYEVMFSRPFAEFRPGEDDAKAAGEIYRIVLGRVSAALGPAHDRATAKDAAIGLFAVVQGLVQLESSGLLGSGPESAERRFRASVTATLHGFAAGKGREAP